MGKILGSKVYEPTFSSEFGAGIALRLSESRLGCFVIGQYCDVSS